MKKWFKRGLFSLVVFVIVALVGAAVFLLTFDPNAYKNKVEQLVYERYQRHLKIEGDIELSLFPRIGLAVEHVSLSDHSSDSTFASLDSARFAVAVWPLLWNKLVVDHVAVSGFKVWLQRDDEGDFNFDNLLQRPLNETSANTVALNPIGTAQAKSSLLAPDANQAEFQIDIAGLDLKDGEIHFYDQASETQMRLVGLELNTGRMTFGQPFDVIFKGHLLGDQPVADATLEGQMLLQLEPHLYRYNAQKMNINLVGTVGPYRAQSATLRGGLEMLTHTEDLRARQLELVSQGQWHDDQLQLNKVQFSLNTAQLNVKRNLQVLQTERLQLRASGALPMSDEGAEHKVEVALDLPNLDLEIDQIRSEPIALSFKQTQGDQLFGVNVRTKAIQGSLEQLALPEVLVNVAGKHGARAWKVDAQSHLQWQQAEQQLDWTDLQASVVVEDELLSPNPAQGKLSGAGQWSVDQHQAWFEGAWASANTHAQIRSDLSHDDHWSLAVQVDAPELDLNPWLRQADKLAAKRAGGVASHVEPYAMLPGYLDWMGLATQLQLNAENVRYRQLQAQAVTAQLEQRDRTLFLQNLEAQLFEGQAQAKGQWQYDQSQLQLQAQLEGINLAQFSEVALGQLRLTGTGKLDADIQTQGSTTGARWASLDGNLRLQAEAGQVVGWNLWKNLTEMNEAVRNVFGGQIEPPSEQLDLRQSTPFNTLDMTLAWQQGQGMFENLKLVTEGLTLQTVAPSYLDAVNQQMELDLQIDLDSAQLPEIHQSLVELSSAPVWMRLSGPWLNPIPRVQWTRLEQPSVIEALDHGLLSLLKERAANGLPLPLPEASSSNEVGKTLGDTLKNLLKN